MIGGAAFTMVASAEGLDGVTQQLTQQLAERFGETVEVEVVAGGKRGATKNALIAKAQANRRRNPFYVNRRAMQTIRFLVNGMTSVVESIRRSAEKAVGDELLVSIGENVEAQKNPDGKGFTPLTEAYARRKQRKFGFTIPILRATGDLLGGLRARVKRHRA